MQRIRFSLGRTPYFWALAFSVLGAAFFMAIPWSNDTYLIDMFGHRARLYLILGVLTVVTALMCARLVDAGFPWPWGLAPATALVVVIQPLVLLLFDGKAGERIVPSLVGFVALPACVAIMFAACIAPLFVGSLAPNTAT